MPVDEPEGTEKRGVRMETGVVQSVRKRRATVAIARTSRCGGCKGCLLSGDGRYMVAEVHDGIGVSPGDSVEMSSPAYSQLSAALLLLLIPVALFIAVYFIIPGSTSSALRLLPAFAAGALPYVLYYAWPRKFNMYITRKLPG